MNITELEKITKQIKKYQLEDEIRDIENWLRKLNEKQIKNLISLEIYPLNKISKPNFKYILINQVALNNDYYLADMMLVNNAKSYKIARFLSSVACNKNSLESKHHREDMKLISNAKSNVTADYLSNVACNNNSLKSDYHRENMKRLANVKDDKDANEIYDNIIKQYEVKNKKNDVIYNIIKQYKVKNKKDYVTFQEKIDAIHQNAIEYTDGDTTKELDDSVFTLK